MHIGTRYMAEALIGRGGFGEVWRGWGPDGPVAIKVLNRDLTEDQELVTRFIQEYHTISAVHHPNVIRVHDLVMDAGRLALIMDLFPDGDLAGYLRTWNRPFPVPLAIHVTAAVADALSAVHTAGIVHRDLKLANILLARVDRSNDAIPVLADFGIARLVASPRLTRKSMVIGTPHYMAPELALGTSEPSPAADVYAAAILLYRLVTGHMPYDHSQPFVILRMHTEQVLAKPDHISPELWSVISACLAKDPRQRPDAATMADWLRELPDAGPSMLLPLPPSSQPLTPPASQPSQPLTPPASQPSRPPAPLALQPSRPPAPLALQPSRPPTPPASQPLTPPPFQPSQPLTPLAVTRDGLDAPARPRARNGDDDRRSVGPSEIAESSHAARRQGARQRRRLIAVGLATAVLLSVGAVTAFISWRETPGDGRAATPGSTLDDRGASPSTDPGVTSTAVGPSSAARPRTNTSPRTRTQSAPPPSLPGPPLALSGTDNQTSKVGTAVTFGGMSVSSGSGPFTWKASNLPSGLSIDIANGTVTGTPKTAGIFTVVVTVADSSVPQRTGSATLTWTVNPTTCWSQLADHRQLQIPDLTTVYRDNYNGCYGNASASAQVTVDIVHPRIGDLVVDLVAPDGTIYNLHNRTGGSTQNLNQTYTLNLSNEAKAGTWRLRIYDAVSGSTGYLNEVVLAL